MSEPEAAAVATEIRWIRESMQRLERNFDLLFARVETREREDTKACRATHELLDARLASLESKQAATASIIAIISSVVGAAVASVFHFVLKVKP